MAFQYGQVKDLYDTLKDAGVTDQSLPEWSQDMNRLSGTDLYSAGLNDNWIKRASHGLDKLIEATGVPAGGESLGRAIGGAVGNEEAGASIGQGLGRAAVNFLPLLVPGAQEAQGARLIGQLGLTGLLSGSETYTNTGSPLAGLIGGATNVAMPGLAGAAERGAAGLGANRVAQFLAGQGAAAGLGEVSKEATALADPTQPYHFNPTEAALNLTLGQAPFFAIHGVSRLVNPVDHVLAVAQKQDELANAQRVTDTRTPIEKIPDVVDPVTEPAVLAEINQRLQQVRGEQVKVEDDLTLSPEEKLDELNKLMGQESEVLRTSQNVNELGLIPKRQPKLDTEKNPPLPIQPDEWKGFTDVFDKADADLEGAVTNGKVAATVDGVNNVLERVGEPPITDAKVQTRTKRLLEAGVTDDPIAAVKLATQVEVRKAKARTEKVKDALTEQQERIRAGGSDTLGEVATTENRGTVNRQVAVPYPKLDADTEAFHSFMDETMSGVQAQKDATDSFNQWRKTTDSADDTTLPLEKERFKTFFRLRESGDIGREDTMTPQDLQTFNSALREDGIGVQKPEVLSDFPQRDHVLNWDDATKERINQMTSGNAAPGAAKPELPAGDRWLFSLGSYDPETNTLNGKHKLPKDGNLGVAAFRNMGGVGKPLTEAEIKVYRQLVPEAFSYSKGIENAEFKTVVGGGKNDKGEFNAGIWERVPDQVNVPKLVEGLKTKGPVVETRKLGEGAAQNPTARELADLTHRFYDSLDEGQQDAITDVISGTANNYQKGLLTKLDQDKLNRYIELKKQNVPEPANARYSFLGPKPESEMPGYVEGLVRVPKPVKEVTNDSGKPATSLSRSEWDALEKRQGLLYAGPHFGSEDTNVLAFYRGYEETLPTGEKAFHVIEVQSDWGQARKTERENVLKQYPFLKNVPENEWSDVIKEKTGSRDQRLSSLADSHPLLRVYESLALKAAIAHAKEIGATKVILSDGETAMMTEEHDRAASTTYPATPENIAKAEHLLPMYEGSEGGLEQALRDIISGKELDPTTDLFNERIEKLGLTPKLTPKQEGGMRLHYDQTLPSAMEKLTGQRGERVEVGLHKNGALRDGDAGIVEDAVRTGNITAEEGQRRLTQGMGSPVFRNPDGTPKSSITGRVYDISNTPDAFTLTDKNRAPVKPYPITDPVDRANADVMGVDRGGRGLHATLLQSADPLFRALAQDLGKFSESLGRIKVMIHDGEASFARDNGDRTVTIGLSKGLLDATRDVQEYTMAHELVHGLTIAELDNPTNAKHVEALNELRNRLVDALPTKMRAAHDEAVSQDWYNKYTRGEASWTEWGKDLSQKEKEIIYGLFTTHELVAQGLSEANMREYMQSVPASGGQAWFSRFANTIRQLIGIGERVPNSAFEEFLSKSDALLQRGEYVSDFTTFATKHFENLGLTPTQVQRQSRRALGLVLDLNEGVNAFESLQNSSGRSLEVVQRRKELNQALADRNGEDYSNLAGVLDELGYDVGVRGLDDFTMESLTLNERNLDALDLMPDVASKYVFAQVKDMDQVLGVVAAAASEKNRGVINLAKPAELRASVNAARRSLEGLLQTSRFHDEAVSEIQGLFAIEPQGLMDKMVAAPQKNLPVWTEDADGTKRGFGSWLKNFLQPTGQLARDNPLSAELIARGHQLTANIRKMASEGLKPFGIDADALGSGNPALSSESVKKAERALKDPRMNKAIDQWIYRTQVEGHKSGSTVMLPDSHPEIAKILAPFSAKDRADITETVIKRQVSNQMMQAQTLEKMQQIAAANGAVVIGRDTGLKANQNIELASTMLEALTTDRSNPQLAQQADAKIEVVRSKLTPETFLRLLKYGQGEAEKLGIWRDFFKANPDWASGQRYGKFLLEYKRGNRTFLAGVESRKEAEAVAQGGTITKFERNQKSEDDQPPVLGPDAIGVVTRLRELEENQLAMLRDRMSPEDVEAVRNTSAVEQFATEESYRGGVPNLRPQPRGLRKGADELPWLSNHFSWVQKTSSFWSRQLLRAQARAHLLEPEIAQAPELQTKLKTHIDNLLQPDPSGAQHMNALASTWFMGFNPASAMVNATQPFVTHVAELTSMTSKPLDSYRRVLKALAEVGGNAYRKNKEWASDEHAKLMHESAQDGEIDYSMFDDRAAADEAIATNYKRIMSGHRVQTLGQQLSTAAGMYTKAGMWMFKGVERVNNQAALLASFDYYREQGLNYTEARDKAYEFNHAVNFGGGRAQRPIGVYSGRGTFARSAAMLSTSMQSYVLGTTFQLSRYIQKGAFRPPGLTPHEVYAARKAGVQMLATQLAAAGTLGLPFVSGALALLDTTFPGLEVNKHLREWVHDLFGGDEENGNILSDMAMTGVPSMLGWDMQSRLSMGNTLPGVSEINGFQPQALLGAPVNLVGQFVKGGVKLAQGDVGGATQSLLPSALKKIAGLAQTGGQVQDYRGRPILSPTAGETLGLALGFQPKRLSDFNAAQRIADQSEKVQQRQEGQYRQGLAEEVLKGNFGNVRQQLLSRAQSDKTYNAVEAVRAVARAAEELTFPRDLRREGTASGSDARSRLLASFRLDPTQPSEEARMQFRQQVEAKLGVMAQPSGEVVTARLMDQLRQQSPDATRSELRRQAESLLRRRAPQTLASPLG